MAIFIVTYLKVLLLVFQQKNVTGEHYWLVAPTSFGIAAMEVAVILLAVEKGWWSIPWMGVGGGLGCATAMYLHKRLVI
jgi:hypothetical protein